VQNHLGGVSILKLGLIRSISLRVALWLIAELRAASSRPGFLNRIGTIHFARWILLPNSDRLVFLSNYDGSWQSYLEDFIARLREGLTSVWSNTRDFPKTTSLFLGGAEDGARFKRWARRQQVPTRFWYSAYPQLTTSRIRANAAIRHGFASASTEAQAAKWLSLFGYAAPENVEKDEVSSLALGGLPFFRFAHCLLVQFSDAARARGWLQSIQGDLSFGEHAARGKRALVTAFTAEGLRALDLDEAAIATFPTAFQEGMSAEQRARALGDESTAKWKWGGGGGSGGVHAALILYATEDAILQGEIAKREVELEKDFGHTVLRHVPMKKLKKDPKDPNKKALDIREPFGFRDGISQPIMRGTKHWSRPEKAIHVVEPGELLLGYRDNLGNVSPTPSSRGEDIGRNGTFLVIRQLQQDVTAFQNYSRDEATKLEKDPRVQGLTGEDLRHWVQASMVGRWRDGSSLVRYPHPPTPGAPREPDNDFRFGREDPDGLRCPFGAHVRRANPRDSLEPGSELQLAISNRHRILRVGRTYQPKPGKKPGLLFMCINADIERQFEFLQQTWILGSNFHGLDNEIDPIVGYRGKDDSMTVPTSRGPVRLQGFARFVKVLGGGYFFIPGKRATRILSGSADYSAP
jgi:Dyp-type peroxidase family